MSNMDGKTKEVNDFMGYGCYGTGFQRARSYLTKEEHIAMLKEYKDATGKRRSRGSPKDQELEAS